MRYFDLHCDTMTTAYTNEKNLTENDLSVSFQKGKCFQRYEQCFALWLDDSLNGNEAFIKAQELLKFFERQSKALNTLSDESGKLLSEKIKVHFTIENGCALGGEIDNLAYFKSHGLEMMTLTWNGENEIGFGAKTQSKKGLKPMGEKVVQQMLEQKIAIDISHLNERGSHDVFEIADKFVVASHSNCYNIHPHERNLRDWQIEEIIKRDGLIGICYYDEFLGANKQTFENLYANIKHIISLGGENVIACGSDFDGCEMGRQMRNLSSVMKFKTYLVEKGIKNDVLEKIFFKNANFFFNNLLH